MGWGILFGCVLIGFALLWRFGKMPRAALELSGAAMLIGVVGYAWQGKPTQTGKSVVSREAESKLDPAIAESRKNLMGQFGTEAQWLDYADTMTRMGSTQLAVLAMRSAIRDNPKSANLWIGLGNALVAHGDGLVSPSARFAFDRAAQLSPKHPGPPLFLGMALARAGQTEEAAQIWTALLARAPKNAPWRSEVEARLAAIGGARP